MKRHILNIFCGIVCTAILWSLLGCSNGNEVNSVSGYYVAKYPNDNGQETIDYIADFKSIPGRVATFDVDNGELTRKLMDYVPYTVSGDTITFQNVKEFKPNNYEEGKTIHGQYDVSSNTLRLPMAVLGWIENTEYHETFTPVDQNLFQDAVKRQYTCNNAYWDGKVVDLIIEINETKEKLTVFARETNYPDSDSRTTILDSVAFEADGMGLVLIQSENRKVEFKWNYEDSSSYYSYLDVGSSIKMTYNDSSYTFYYW